MLAWRIHIEEHALASRRTLDASGKGDASPLPSVGEGGAHREALGG
jgi:hypothetical protein